MDKLFELASALNQQNEFQEILRLVSQDASAYLNAEIASIIMINPRTQDTLKTVCREGAEISHPKYKALQTQVCGWVHKNNRSILSHNINEDQRFPNVKNWNIPVKSVIGVPLRTEGVCFGALVLLNSVQRDNFNESDLSDLEKLSLIAAPYLRNVHRIQEFFNPPLPEKALTAKYEKFGLLGKSRPFVEMLNSIEAAARCDVRVLLMGESGTGKELVARAIHNLSKKSQGPFVAIDCGAISASLLESELFGHKKGAFTGAAYDRKGLIEEANSGTLFLDEIASIPLEIQTKFMRFLQESEIRPVGSNKSLHVDVRIISASSGSFEQKVREKLFREDLFYRLHVYPINIPSLSSRKEDIPVLTEHFLNIFAKQQDKKATRFDNAIEEFLKKRRWPGNVRELENFVERLITLAKPNAGVLSSDLLPGDLKVEFQESAHHDHDSVTLSLPESVEACERKLIEQALDRTDGNQSQAARTLRISVQTLRYKIRKLGIGTT